MPTLPLAACAFPGCPGRAPFKRRYCPEHDTARSRKVLGAPPRSTAPYDRQWQKLRKMFLNNFPLCVECEKAGRVTVAQVVDHVTLIAVAPERRLEWDNLQSLCVECHNAKTRREQGNVRD